jgi:WD40 repeat protein
MRSMSEGVVAIAKLESLLRVGLQTLKGYTDIVNLVAFSHDSRWLASASSDKTVRLRNTETGELLQTFYVGFARVNISFHPYYMYLLTERGSILLDPGDLLD